MKLSPKVSKKQGFVSIRVDKFNANFDLVANWRLEKLNLYGSIFNDIVHYFSEDEVTVVHDR